jgi:hypothetical protein
VERNQEHGERRQKKDVKRVESRERHADAAITTEQAVEVWTGDGALLASCVVTTVPNTHGVPRQQVARQTVAEREEKQCYADYQVASAALL